MEGVGEAGPVRFPPPAIYVSGVLLAIVAETLWPTNDPSSVIRILAALLMLIFSILLDGAATRLFRRNDTPMLPWQASRKLVTDGPYRFTRNPMYLGMACLYVGIMFAFGLMWGFLLLPVVVLAVDRLVIAREEPYLERTFGEDYTRYKTRVRRWL